MRYERATVWDDVSMGSKVRVRLYQEVANKRTWIGTSRGLSMMNLPGGPHSVLTIEGCKGGQYHIPAWNVRWVEVMVEQEATDG